MIKNVTRPFKGKPKSFHTNQAYIRSYCKYSYQRDIIYSRRLKKLLGIK